MREIEEGDYQFILDRLLDMYTVISRLWWSIVFLSIWLVVLTLIFLGVL
jgi:hypothetical protein